MESRSIFWLLGLLMACSGDPREGDPPSRTLRATNTGKEFVTACFPNVNSNKPSRLEIVVTCMEHDTEVSITSNKTNLMREVRLKKGETRRIPIPAKIGSQAVVIKSSSDITMFSCCLESSNEDMALMLPTNEWGTEYYVITPEIGPQSNKEFTVISGSSETTMNVTLTGDATFEGRTYLKGSVISRTVAPFQSNLFQGKDGLSGSRVAASLPMAVLISAGSERDNSHVYENIYSAQRWGGKYFAAPISSNNDTVYVMTSKTTIIQYTLGTASMNKTVGPGELLQININKSSPLSITSQEKMQVLYHGKGTVYNNKPSGPFLSLVPNVDQYCRKFNLISEQNDNNTAVLTAKTASRAGITLNGKCLEDIAWNEFSGTEYSWAIIELGFKFGSHTLQHPYEAFGLIITGYGNREAYGTVAACTQGADGPPSP